MSVAETESGCPECGGRIVARGDERVCEQCGLVTGADHLDRGPEWRTTADTEEPRRRTGAPLTRTRHDRGLSTEIGYTSGADVPAGNPRRIARLRREHNRAQIRTKAERNRVYGFTEIRRLCSALELAGGVRERSCVVFERAQKEGLFQGRCLEGFAAAAVYAACRIARVGRSREEVIEASRADPGEFEAAYGALNRDLGLAIAPQDPREHLPRVASKLDLASRVERRARGYARQLIEAGCTAGRKPGGIAGGCLYQAAADLGSDVTQREVADAANVSPVTLRGTCGLIEEHVGADPDAGPDG